MIRKEYSKNKKYKNEVELNQDIDEKNGETNISNNKKDEVDTKIIYNYINNCINRFQIFKIKFK